MPLFQKPDLRFWKSLSNLPATFGIWVYFDVKFSQIFLTGSINCFIFRFLPLGFLTIVFFLTFFHCSTKSPRMVEGWRILFDNRLIAWRGFPFHNQKAACQSAQNESLDWFPEILTQEFHFFWKEEGSINSSSTDKFCRWHLKKCQKIQPGSKQVQEKESPTRKT